MPRDKRIKKTMVLGSGPIVIGQAAEFDYAGSQACRVLKDEGVNVVLVNSNPATIMTDADMADEIYLEPLTAATVKRVIEKERPDSLLAGLGGQTGLTIAMQLAKEGFLEKNGVRLIGTNAEAIDKAEDRQIFKETMQNMGQPVIPSGIATTPLQAAEVAEELGYPVIVRPAFTLGGAGGGVAIGLRELEPVVQNGLLLSPITQVLIEKYIYGWKEIEFEVMRDSAGNIAAICSMENVDPVGVHTGDSIVVAPALTLSDKEYSMLHDAALDIVAALGIEGGCNVQLALDPDSLDYAVIEVNPRVSRSSALASKATGYPIAKITAKIALGYTLDEIKNDITGKSCAGFEPAPDYIVVKIPKWPFDKFHGAEHRLGTRMKATGEVMAIAPSFEMALMKAVRGAEISLDTLDMPHMDFGNIRERLKVVDDLRLFAIFRAFKEGVSVDEVFEATKINRWFLGKIRGLAEFEKEISGTQLNTETYLRAKRLGYPDNALKRIAGRELPVQCDAVYKIVDTCAEVFNVKNPYFYAVYDDYCESRACKRNGAERIIVLGSGPIRIGQGIEFDYSSVHCVKALKSLGYEVIIINNNPETVSTDFDTSDRLYFEPLCEEDVMNVIRAEQPSGVVVAFGGQTAIKLTRFLANSGVAILGTSAESIDIAEDRERFDALLEKLKINRPKGTAVLSEAQAIRAAHELGYPVLVRPSYVIGGQNMTIAYSDREVSLYMSIILEHGADKPVLVDKYLMGTELEVDVICDGEDVLIPGIMEHVERAGVHSGDSIAVYPPHNLDDKMLNEVVECSKKLALAMHTKGLVNIQYVIYLGELYVIEVNPRASRTVPYISKVTGIPMVTLAAKVMVGHMLKDLGFGTGLCKTPPYYAVKVPVFSFDSLSDANSFLGPEMKSTGEVLGIGKTVEEGLFKGLVSAGFNVPSCGHERHGVLISVNDYDKFELVALTKKLDDLGFRFYATDGTAREIRNIGADVSVVGTIRESNEIMELLEKGAIDYVVYTGTGEHDSVADYIHIHKRALQLSIACLTSLDTANALADIIQSRFNQSNTELVDLNNMRKQRRKLGFAKMQGTGDDYIFVDNINGEISCPESLAISFSDRHYGIGGTGLVLIESSDTADAKMRIFNRDGSEGGMAGNSIRCVGKYLNDNGIVQKERLTIETASGVRELRLYITGGRVGSVCVDMGTAELAAKKVPVAYDGGSMIDAPITVGGREYRVTCLSIGNPHCVVFCDKVDAVYLPDIGPKFEYNEIFPERVNTEFVRAVNSRTLKMRVWERGNGETWSCGTGACAAVVAAAENGMCKKGEDITVKLKGGDLIVNYTDERVLLTGNAKLVYTGEIEY